VSTHPAIADDAALRWPLQPLLDACDVTPARLALLVGVAVEAVREAARCGLSDTQADLWAVRAGYHPVEVWGWARVDAATTPPPRVRFGPRTTSARIAADLRARIDRGDLRPGDPLPSRRDLAEHWGVTTTTVGRATRAL
jgi:Bacterial regulatory proteins, gntR family